MKKIFFCMLAAVLLLAVGFISYGIYINSIGESNINDRMANRQIELQCTVAKNREIALSYMVDNIVMQSTEISDAVSKAEGVLDEVYVHKNQQVKAGDPLFSIINHEIPLKKAQAESSLAKVIAQQEQAASSFKRYEELVELHAASMEKYEEAKANYKAANAAVREAQAQLDLISVMEEYTTVTAPVDGTVTIIYKHKGDYVQIGTPVCYIGNFSDMWFSCNMSDDIVQKFLSNYSDKNYYASFDDTSFSKVYSTEYGVGNKGSKQDFNIKVHGIYPDLSKPAAMRRVVWHINNEAALLEPRNYNNVSLSSSEKTTIFSVPRSAMKNNSNTEIFVIADGKLESRKVVCGAGNKEFVEIISGLNPGDVVVISGTDGLRDGMSAIALMEDI